VILTVDAHTEDDLRVIAERLVHASSPALVAGSAGIAVALADVLSAGQDDSGPRGGLISTARRVLIVTASQRLVVDEQIHALGNEIGLVQIEVSIDEIIEGIRSESVKRITEMVGRDGVVVLKFGKFDVDGESGISELRTKAEMIVRNLGDVVRTVTDRSNPNVLILIGGDTTSGVLEACEVASLELQGELQSGTVSGAPLSGSITDTLLITRAGGFGDEKSLAELVSLLRTGRSV
jgi:uncharacterized protein YgbK (DUF1537 family)